MPPQDVPKEYLKVADYLLNSKHSGLQTREGIMNERRVRYFKGSEACSSLLEVNYVHKTRPKIASRVEAETVLQVLLDSGLIVKSSIKDNYLTMAPTNNFTEDDHYVWLYEGSKLKAVLSAVGLVGLVLFLVMFPLWPALMRDGVWYISISIIGLLGLLMFISVIRLIFYLSTYVILKPGIWIFPNLFEDVGFFESFVPLWGWDVAVCKKEKQSISKKKVEEKATQKQVEEIEELSEEEAMQIFRLLEPSLEDLNMTFEELLEHVDEEDIMGKVEANVSKVHLKHHVNTPSSLDHSQDIMEDDGDENYIDVDTDEEYENRSYGEVHKPTRSKPKIYTGLYDVD
ncbi:Translocation protein S62 [Basidiobolus ranarum]|uniref:Translocation protein SEC62 n=1 Tax=Basidiobolus ranarum TaxID=34480 RepID=A0ABR2WV65_9FUNG